MPKFVLAKNVDLRGINDQLQEELLFVAGNEFTLLPESLEDGSIPFVVSCFDETSPDWDKANELTLQFFGVSLNEYFRSIEYLCEGEQMRTGTPWPLDEPPPWEAEGIDPASWSEKRLTSGPVRNSEHGADLTGTNLKWGVLFGE